MKPEWKDAPAWANWLARDFNGAWFWYEEEPWPSNAAYFIESGRYEVATRGKGKLKSLKKERRPE